MSYHTSKYKEIINWEVEVWLGATAEIYTCLVTAPSAYKAAKKAIKKLLKTLVEEKVQPLSVLEIEYESFKSGLEIEAGINRCQLWSELTDHSGYLNNEFGFEWSKQRLLDFRKGI